MISKLDLYKIQNLLHWPDHGLGLGGLGLGGLGGFGLGGLGGWW